MKKTLNQITLKPIFHKLLLPKSETQILKCPTGFKTKCRQIEAKYYKEMRKKLSKKFVRGLEKGLVGVW